MIHTYILTYLLTLYDMDEDLTELELSDLV